MSPEEQAQLTNRQWANTAIDQFRDAMNEFLNMAMYLPEELSDSALVYAEVLDNWAMSIEKTLHNLNSKKANKTIAKIRKSVCTPDVLYAINGFYEFLQENLE